MRPWALSFPRLLCFRGFFLAGLSLDRIARLFFSFRPSFFPLSLPFFRLPSLERFVFSLEAFVRRSAFRLTSTFSMEDCLLLDDDLSSRLGDSRGVLLAGESLLEIVSTSDSGSGSESSRDSVDRELEEAVDTEEERAGESPSSSDEDREGEGRRTDEWTVSNLRSCSSPAACGCLFPLVNRLISFSFISCAKCSKTLRLSANEGRISYLRSPTSFGSSCLHVEYGSTFFSRSR